MTKLQGGVGVSRARPLRARDWHHVREHSSLTIGFVNLKQVGTKRIKVL